MDVRWAHSLIPPDPLTGLVSFRNVRRPPWEEESPDKYDPGGFHSVRVGDIYNHRYQVIRKLGAGAYSTVWMANDMRYYLTSDFAN